MVANEELDCDKDGVGCEEQMGIGDFLWFDFDVIIWVLLCEITIEILKVSCLCNLSIIFSEISRCF